MKTAIFNLGTMLTLALAIFICVVSCDKRDNPAPGPSLSPETDVTAINLIGLKADSGFAYKIGYALPQSGDSNISPRSSTLQLFENGIPLGPAHSEQNDIRLYGLGQFSHWGTTLYFSSSDNSNPLTNGRKYTYRIN